MIRFRHGLVIGLAVGYYLGTKAGRQRYEQINTMLDKLRGTPHYADARTTLSELYEQGRLRTKGLLDQATGGAVDMILDARPAGTTETTLGADPTLN